MRGAIPPLPIAPVGRGAQLKAQRQLHLLPYLNIIDFYKQYITETKYHALKMHPVLN
jgi:hypothetical protein